MSEEKHIIDPAFIEEHRARVNERINKVMAQRTEILEAFIAKYGWNPEEVEQCVMSTLHEHRYFVRKRLPLPLEQENVALKAAALDVVKRWHSPQWKWDEHTGVLIKRLADAAGIDINEL